MQQILDATQAKWREDCAMWGIYAGPLTQKKAASHDYLRRGRDAYMSNDASVMIAILWWSLLHDSAKNKPNHSHRAQYGWISRPMRRRITLIFSSQSAWNDGLGSIARVTFICPRHDMAPLSGFDVSLTRSLIAILRALQKRRLLLRQRWRAVLPSFHLGLLVSRLAW